MSICVRVENVSKEFQTEKDNSVHALNKTTVNIYKNDFVCIIGPSGCGKSTLLRIIAGLETATTGKVFYNGEEHKETSGDIGMVFQQYSLLPWRTVEENIALGLEFKNKSKEVKKEVVQKYLEMIDMKEFGKAYPFELSGGMQQRVAIVRALANNPEMLLMDEPFGALDAHTRILMQKELLNIWEKNKKTILFVTHSVDEAIYLADKIIVMSRRPGKIKELIDIEMPRPRNRGDLKYAQMSSNILMMLEEEVVNNKI